MKRTDILTGRIIQRILTTKSDNDIPEVVVVHGVDEYHNIERLVDNLFEYFKDSEITLKKLKYGYELKIRVAF